MDFQFYQVMEGLKARVGSGVEIDILWKNVRCVVIILLSQVLDLLQSSVTKKEHQ